MLKASDIVAVIKAGVAAKPNNVWPVYGSTESLDRTNFVTSSETGYCARKVWFDKRALTGAGYSPERGTMAMDEGSDSWGVWERGHNVEAWLMETLHRGNNSKYVILLTGKEQRSFYHDYQSGTPDGIIILADGVMTLEVKSIDPRTNVAKLPKQAHIKQCIQNCDLVSHTLDKSPLGSALVYVDAADYSKLYPYDIPFDDAVADSLIDRARLIVSATDAAELMPEGIYQDQCKFCNHKGRCSALETAKVKNGELTNGFDFKAAAAAVFGPK